MPNTNETPLDASSRRF